MDCSSEISVEDEQTDDLQYFLPNEVVIHNKPDDIWVSFLRQVYDLTTLVKEYDGEDIIKPLLAHAGKDITEWFNPEDGELLQYTHPVTWCSVPYTPHGQLPHLHPLAPTTAWKPLKVTPWWKDTKYMIGYITICPRPIKIVNVLTGHTDCIQVCSEDTLKRIQERFFEYNYHIGSYTWKYDKMVLDMNLNLEENGIPDERKEFNDLQLMEDFYIPEILIYYNDDLTEA